MSGERVDALRGTVALARRVMAGAAWASCADVRLRLNGTTWDYLDTGHTHEFMLMVFNKPM